MHQWSIVNGQWSIKEGTLHQERQEVRSQIITRLEETDNPVGILSSTDGILSNTDGILTNTDGILSNTDVILTLSVTTPTKAAATNHLYSVPD